MNSTAVFAGPASLAASNTQSVQDSAADVPEILLVEDDELVRLVLSQSLAEAGYAVVSAASAEVATTMLERRPSLLVTDLNLGEGMDGLTFGQHAKRRWPGLNILYITGEPFRLLHYTCSVTEAVLLKPFREAAILAAIEDGLRTSGLPSG